GVPDGKLSDGWKLRWRARATSNGVNGTWTDWHPLEVSLLVARTSTGVTTSAAAASWTPERIKVDECQDDNKPWLWIDRRAVRKNRPGGWLKNRFSWCFWGYTFSYTYTIDKKTGERVYNEQKGYRVTVIAETSNTSRDFVVKVGLDDFHTIMPPRVGPEKITRDDLYAVAVTSSGNGTSCQQNSPTPGLEKYSSAMHWWEDAGGNQHTFHLTSPTSFASDKQAIHNCRVSINVQWEFSEDRWNDDLGPEVRCDTSPAISQFGAKNGGCVFRGITSSLEIGKGDGWDDVYDHLKLAKDDPDSTIPTWNHTDKDIPGFSEKYALKRGGYLGIEDYNRGAAVAECERKWGYGYAARYNLAAPWGTRSGPGGSCDEFPFNDTYQGVRYTRDKALKNYSVAVIDGTQNSNFGSAQSLWYSRDRVIDGDRFFIRFK
ncbi:hypothetical protein ABZ815_52475, partial [Nonomuraea sp. NPDC047529]|uniref:hypothetical protein n=1 Tax=Nonomuraea sp. NPDC047529 TaxID=3155623 RepID=UPI0033C3B349